MTKTYVYLPGAKERMERSINLMIGAVVALVCTVVLAPVAVYLAAAVGGAGLFLAVAAQATWESLVADQDAERDRLTAANAKAKAGA
ncbi:MAG: hypothetical protein H0W48_00330 [Methylibium sp.]|nr:hypothetical protein [Methylibium sp.]